MLSARIFQIAFQMVFFIFFIFEDQVFPKLPMMAYLSMIIKN